MDKTTRKKLEARGWKIGDAGDFLDLTEAEAAFIEMKLSLAANLRARRLERHLNQTQVARIIGSSQSRVAKWRQRTPASPWTLWYARSSSSARIGEQWRRQ